MKNPKVGDLILITEYVSATSFRNAMTQFPKGTICMCVDVLDSKTSLSQFLTTRGVFCIWNHVHMELL
jgi:hypothetical protein